MIEFCYQEKINNYFVPNGTPPFIVDKMKKITDENDTKLVLVYLAPIENRFSKRAISLQKIKKEK